MKQYTVLVLLGQIFLRTVAQVTISTYNVADAGTFEVGSKVTVMCEIQPYSIFMNWKIASTVVADCTLSACSTRSALPGHYSFSHNTGSGIFNLTINPVKLSDNGSILLCENEGRNVSLVVTVQELVVQTVRRSCCTICDEECFIIVLCIGVLWGWQCFWVVTLFCNRKTGYDRMSVSSTEDTETQKTQTSTQGTNLTSLETKGHSATLNTHSSSGNVKQTESSQSGSGMTSVGDAPNLTDTKASTNDGEANNGQNNGASTLDNILIVAGFVPGVGIVTLLAHSRRQCSKKELTSHPNEQMRP